MLVTQSNLSTRFKPTISLSALEQDLLIYILSRINPLNPHFEKVTFDVKKFLTTTYRDNMNSYKPIRDALRRLRKNELAIAGHKYGSWFSFVIADLGESDFTVHIDPEIKQHVTDLKSDYVKFQSDMVFRFRSSYSKKFYPFLKSLSDRKHKKYNITLQELKDLFGITDTYAKASHFKQRVLIVMQKELEEKADIYFTFTMKKKNRSYHSVDITIHKKEDLTDSDKIEIDPHNPIVKYLKDRYGFSFSHSSKILNLKPENRSEEEFIENLEGADAYIKKQTNTNKKVDPSGVVKAFIKNNWKPNPKPPKKKPKESPKPPTASNQKNETIRKKEIKKNEQFLSRLRNDLAFRTAFIEYLGSKYNDPYLIGALKDRDRFEGILQVKQAILLRFSEGFNRLHSVPNAKDLDSFIKS